MRVSCFPWHLEIIPEVLRIGPAAHSKVGQEENGETLQGIRPWREGTGLLGHWTPFCRRLDTGT